MMGRYQNYHVRKIKEIIMQPLSNLTKHEIKNEPYQNRTMNLRTIVKHQLTNYLREIIRLRCYKHNKFIYLASNQENPIKFMLSKNSFEENMNIYCD